MKFFIFLILSSLQIGLKAQAHLGVSLNDLKIMYPNKYFNVSFSDDGTKYITTQMPLGSFSYYFNSQTGLTESCIQIPNNLTDLNTQVEIYNKKYVIVSEIAWKAYLEGGGMMKILLKYNEEYKLYAFHYWN